MEPDEFDIKSVTPGGERAGAARREWDGQARQPLPVYATSGVIGTFALPPDSIAASSAADGGASSSKGNFSPL